MLSRRSVALIILALLATANLVFHRWFLHAVEQLALARERPLELYSFIGDDYPSRLPLQSARPAVRLTVEDTLEWLYTATRGDGDVRLGPQRRLFSVTMSHQLHCLRSIRATLKEEGVPEGKTRSHFVHCLNLLREHTLCAADNTLEPVDALSPNSSFERLHGEHRCMDWDAFYDTMLHNYLDFKHWISERAS
ncbi:hypothetical protein OBBRIDRAFT_821491 [Obba rivulosa]|uniref:Uncharacterized protein n=1 Tax=Obba rivulosa TaxID=1052685 RepID=A0A8E2AP35_9APHY|nr:hypothetical protein OBBRIDRAFT_821491 [Obba rivulosa]